MLQEGMDTLQPSQLTKPQRVWVTSHSIRICFYQCHPISDSYTIFYKKSGALFGTEITLPSASILGPDLSIKQPGTQDTEVRFISYRRWHLNERTAAHACHWVEMRFA